MKNKLKPNMVVVVHNPHIYSTSNELNMVVNTKLGLCLVDRTGHSIELDKFDNNLESFFYKITRIYGFSEYPNKAMSFDLEGRDLLYEI